MCRPGLPSQGAPEEPTLQIGYRAWAFGDSEPVSREAGASTAGACTSAVLNFVCLRSPMGIAARSINPETWKGKPARAPRAPRTWHLLCPLPDIYTSRGQTKASRPSSPLATSTDEHAARDTSFTVLKPMHLTCAAPPGVPCSAGGHATEEPAKGSTRAHRLRQPGAQGALGDYSLKS